MLVYPIFLSQPSGAFRLQQVYLGPSRNFTSEYAAQLVEALLQGVENPVGLITAISNAPLSVTLATLL